MLTLIAASTLFLALFVHVASALVVWARQARSRGARVRLSSTSAPGIACGPSELRKRDTGTLERPHVYLVIPVASPNEREAETMSSAFNVTYRPLSIVFAVPSVDDPAYAMVKGLIAHHGSDALLLVGRENTTHNPKLDNVEKALAVVGEWVLMIDSNVRIPPDVVEHVLARGSPETGAVSAVPLGVTPQSFSAEIEAAFLNTYQARLQLTTDILGRGYVHGKLMYFRKSLLDKAGGPSILAKHIGDDTALDDLVRSRGLQVRLLDRPVEHPLGVRNLKSVWRRQVRWAMSRRQSVPIVFALEPLTSILVPMAAGATLALTSGLSSALVIAAIIAVWFGTEAMLARVLAWPYSAAAPFAAVVREGLMLAIWCRAWFGVSYVWRGNVVQMEPDAWRQLGRTRVS